MGDSVRLSGVFVAFSVALTKYPRRNHAMEEGFRFGSWLWNALHHDGEGTAGQWLLAVVPDREAACLHLCGPKYQRPASNTGLDFLQRSVTMEGFYNLPKQCSYLGTKY